MKCSRETLLKTKFNQKYVIFGKMRCCIATGKKMLTDVHFSAEKNRGSKEIDVLPWKIELL